MLIPACPPLIREFFAERRTRRRAACGSPLRVALHVLGRGKLFGRSLEWSSRFTVIREGRSTAAAERRRCSPQSIRVVRAPARAGGIIVERSGSSAIASASERPGARELSSRPRYDLIPPTKQPAPPPVVSFRLDAAILSQRRPDVLPRRSRRVTRPLTPTPTFYGVPRCVTTRFPGRRTLVIASD